MSKQQPDRTARIVRHLNVIEKAERAREYTCRDPRTGNVSKVQQDVIVRYDKDGLAVSYWKP